MSYLRNFRPCVFAVVFLLAGLVSSGPASAHSVSAQINEINAKWLVAVAQGDSAMIEALYTPDGLLLPSNSPPIEGAKAIAGVWKSWSELPNVKIGFGTTRLEVSSSGDMAMDYGWYTFAFDTDNGDKLWQTRVTTSAQGFPITYLVDGKQYIAMPVGVGGASWSNLLPRELAPELSRPSNGNSIYVFALPN